MCTMYQNMLYGILHTIHATKSRNLTDNWYAHPQRIGDVSSIFNQDCFQSSVRKHFCYRPRYISCLSLRIGSPGFSTQLARDVPARWGCSWILVPHWYPFRAALSPSQALPKHASPCACLVLHRWEYLKLRVAAGPEGGEMCRRSRARR